MSTNEQTPLSQPTSVVRNTLGKEQAPQNLVRPISDEDLREYCDKNYHQILSIIAKKLHQEKAQQEKLKAVKARLNFEEASRYSESETPSIRMNLKERLGPRYARTRSGSPKPRHGRSKSPREKDRERRTVFKRLEKGTQKAATKVLALKKHKLLPRSIAIKESIREERKQCQKKKCIKDPVEIHNIKQRDGESTEEFVRRYKLECRDVKGAPECMKISGFMHGITNPELIKRLHDKIPKSMDEMISVTTTFLRGEEIKNQLIPANTPLVGFSREIIWPLGQISLLVKIGDEEHSTSTWMNFMVVRSPSPYNGIIRRPEVRKIRAILSMAYEMLKFPVAGEIVTLRSSMIIPLECSMVSEPGVPRPVINQVTKEKIHVVIHPKYPEQTIAIGSTLTEEGRKELCGLLRRHLDVFAWKPTDMTGVPST
nr:reverse transcriptase domain-containing protein [Tanacetum cinerariifolium]